MLKVILLSLDGLFFEYETKETNRDAAIKAAYAAARKSYPEEFSLFRVEEYY